MSQDKDLAELTALLALEQAHLADAGQNVTVSPPHLIARDAIALRRLARRATSLAVRQCNEPLPEDYIDKRRESIRKATAAILVNYGVSEFHVAGDPRGLVLQFKPASGRANSLGGLWGVVP